MKPLEKEPWTVDLPRCTAVSYYFRCAELKDAAKWSGHSVKQMRKTYAKVISKFSVASEFLNS